MPWWGWALMYAATVWGQLALSAFFGPSQTAPDLLLAAAVTVGLLRGPLPGAACGLALGLSGDLLVGRLIGLGAIAIGIPGIIAGLVARRMFRENLVVLSAIAVVLGSLSSVVYALGAALMGVKFDLVRAILVVGLPVGIYNGVLVPVLFAVTHKRLTPGAGSQGV